MDRKVSRIKLTHGSMRTRTSKTSKTITRRLYATAANSGGNNFPKSSRGCTCPALIQMTSTMLASNTHRRVLSSQSICELRDDEDRMPPQLRRGKFRGHKNAAVAPGDLTRASAAIASGRYRI